MTDPTDRADTADSEILIPHPIPGVSHTQLVFYSRVYLHAAQRLLLWATIITLVVLAAVTIQTWCTFTTDTVPWYVPFTYVPVLVLTVCGFEWARRRYLKARHDLRSRIAYRTPLRNNGSPADDRTIARAIIAAHARAIIAAHRPPTPRQKDVP